MAAEPDQYSMPNIADLTASNGQSRVFSKLDLLKCYFRVPVHQDDVSKTTIITQFGSYIFAAYEGSGICDLPFCLVYVDDILIFSDNDTDHAEHLQRVLQLLKDNGLVVRPDKCIFGVSKVDFMGPRDQRHWDQAHDEQSPSHLRFPSPNIHESRSGISRNVELLSLIHT